MTRNCMIHPARILLGLASMGAAHAATFHVGSGCAYSTIAAAVTAAKANAGADLIAVNTGSYAITTYIDINDSSDLTIQGGYASCSATASTGQSTLDAGTKPTASAAVLFHHGAGALALRNLRIANNDDTGIYGGAIKSLNAGALTVSDSMLDHNKAHTGAGIFISHDNGTRGQLNVTNTILEYNSADHNGGGIYALATEISITGDTEFNINAAGVGGADGDGGGIFAQNSNLLVSGHTPVDRYFLNSNGAFHGGALMIYETNGGPYTVTLQNDRADEPLVIANNTAYYSGGALGLYADSTSEEIITTVNLWNVTLDLNSTYGSSGSGDAVFIQAYDPGAGHPAIVNVKMSQSDQGGNVPRCTPGLECNVISNSESGSANRSTVSVNQIGAAASAGFHLYRGYMRGNSATHALISGSGYITVDNSVIARNSFAAYLFDFSGNAPAVSNSTIAANNEPNAAVYILFNLANSAFALYHNIIDQPGDSLCASIGGSKAVYDLMLTSGTGVGACTGGTNVVFGNPLFVDRGNGNVRPAGFASEAVDHWAAATSGNTLVPTFDLDGGARPVIVADQNKPYDLGAYEWGSVSDRVFAGGFELP